MLRPEAGDCLEYLRIRMVSWLGRKSQGRFMFSPVGQRVGFSACARRARRPMES